MPYEFLNIIIPVYNEKDNIIKTLNEIESKIDIKYHVVIVYDFEEDNTLPPLKKYIEEKQTDTIIMIKNKYGRGALNAIKTGFESIETGVMLVVMADLSDDLSVVNEMFDKVNSGFDIVCGSRYMKGGKQKGGPRFKGLLSRIAGLSLHYITGIPTKDVTNSFKMYTAKIFNDIKIESNGGFELGMEIVVKSFLKGYKITESPSVWTGRATGESNFKLWRWLPKYLYWYFYAVLGKLFKKPFQNLINYSSV